ncbi:YgaP family membrane protein [Aeromonas jandaei]|uniref:YgaP family membrane protein n=1 Tax=Aeromonas jandaei TaxID=650 RepID=UPI003B9DDB4C
MTVDNGVRIVAGCMLLLSLILTAWVHPGFVWLSTFVGVNLIQSAFTGFCPAAIILRRLGFK